MKILHVVPYFAPAWAFGGPPRAVYEIAKRQVKQGLDVTVVTTDAYQENETLKSLDEEIEGIKVKRLKNLSNYLLWYFRFSTPMDTSKIKVDNFDVIHFHETRTLLNYIFLKKVKKQKVVLSPWGTLPYNNQMLLLKKMYDVAFVNPFLNNIDVILGQNQHEIEEIKNFGFKGHTNLLPLGIDVNFFQKLSSRINSREMFNISKQVFVFAFLGRFARAKGLELLLKAFAQFSNNKKDVVLFIVGRDDGYLREMEKLIQELNLGQKVIIHGPLYEKDRINAYCVADIFIHPAIEYEETATTCLEALSCNVPVITTQCAQIPFLTEEDGVYQVQTDLNNMVNCMDRLYKNPKLEVNLPKLKKYFDWDQIVTNLTDIYQ